MNGNLRALIATAALCYCCAGDFDELWESAERFGLTREELEDILEKYSSRARRLADSAVEILAEHVEPAVRIIIGREVIEETAKAMGFALRKHVDLKEVVDAIEGHPNWDEISYLVDDAVTQVLKEHRDEWLERL